MLNTIHKKTNIAPPRIQEIAKLKNNGIKLFRRLVVKNVIAAEGMQNNAMQISGFINPSLTFVLLLIIQTFSKEVMDTHVPIPTIKAFIPITAGRNQIPINRKTEPIK